MADMNDKIETAICPSCGQEFPLEDWRQEDGTCPDGKFYCLSKDCKCGCVTWTDKR